MPAKPRRPRPLPPHDPAHADAAIVHLAPQARATEARQRTFLAELERTGRVVDAAHAAGLTTSTVYRLRDRSDAFAAAWDHARAHCEPPRVCRRPLVVSHAAISMFSAAA
jgi:hypothetical protein